MDYSGRGSHASGHRNGSPVQAVDGRQADGGEAGEAVAGVGAGGGAAQGASQIDTRIEVVMLQLTWDEFVAAAMRELARTQPVTGEPKFMLNGGYGRDYEAYLIPNYVLCNLTETEE